jgi:hypothetical protein
MSQFGKDLKVYSDNGFRSTEDWFTLGRDIKPHSVCRVTLKVRGDDLKLFSRDQTQPRLPSTRSSRPQPPAQPAQAAPAADAISTEVLK